MDASVGGISLFAIVPASSTYKTDGWNNYDWQSSWNELRDNDDE